MSIGIRLREERERLGFSQAGFAEIAGAHRKSQGNYELGERMPDAAYLSAIAAAGADVLYILTGQRSAPATPSLNPRQRALLNHYDHCDEEGKRHLETTASYVAQQQVAVKKRA
ncbi:MAG: helix-turn-helix transcriptional regulator [Gallionella sp.]|nr:helix-turn-helix transcriptional regulator [Gallionella sp.]